MSFNKNSGSNSPLVFPTTVLPSAYANSALVSPRIGALFPGTEDFAANVPRGAALEDAMAEVSQVRAAVTKRVWPVAFLELHHPRDGFNGERIPGPLSFTGVSASHPDGAAQLVRHGHPTDLGKWIDSWLASAGVAAKNATGHVDFVESIDRFARLARRVAAALEAAFRAKWYHGSIRPEEHVQLNGSVYTAYQEGCPAHPECPAGHGAVSGATYAHMLREYDLTSEQQDEIYDACYHFRMYRTFAGVHIAFSNAYGFAIGQRVVDTEA
jgi:hypothetical protein